MKRPISYLRLHMGCGEGLSSRWFPRGPMLNLVRLYSLQPALSKPGKGRK